MAILLAAGLFPAVERRFSWRIFSVLPPIVLTYLLVTALAVSGLRQINDKIRAAQSMLTSHMVPALLFLLMINCDLRAIYRLGPRVLGVFACTSISLFIAFISACLIYKRWPPSGFAKLFRFDLCLCGISSLAHIGGVAAATPVLAASYSRALMPVGVLLAQLGYILGTGYGMLVATVMSALAGP